MKTSAYMRKVIMMLALMLCSVVSYANTQSGKCGENVSWEFDSTTGVLSITGTGAMYDYGYISGMDTSPWYLKRTLIKSIKISEGVSTIGSCSFLHCTTLEDVSIPTSILSINTGAFLGCKSIIQIDLPNGLKYIGDSAFSGCEKLEDIVIPGTVENIEKYVFSETALINNHVDGALYSGSCLIIYKGEFENNHYEVKDGTKIILGHAFNQKANLFSIKLPESLLCIGDYAFSYCEGLKNVNIPDSVKIIGECAFQSCFNLKDVKLGESVETLEDRVFYACRSLQSIDLPLSVKTIGSDAFSLCDSLKAFNVRSLSHWCKVDLMSGASTPAIQTGSLMLNGEILDEIIIPNDITEIKNHTFGSVSNIKSVKLHENIIKIGNGSFAYCTSLDSLDIPDSVITIGTNAFSCCSELRSITIGTSVSNIWSNAFGGCSKLNDVNIKDLSSWCKINFTSYSSNPCYIARAFKLNGEKIRYLEIPEGVTEIKDIAFHRCTELFSVVIPESVKKIGEQVFTDCNIYKVTCLRKRFPSISNNTFDFDKAILYVPNGLKSVYENSNIWSKFKAIYEFEPSSIENILIDEEDVEYYDLTGMRVKNPTSGVYIMKRGTQSSKVIIK